MAARFERSQRLKGTGVGRCGHSDRFGAGASWARGGWQQGRLKKQSEPGFEGALCLVLLDFILMTR